MNTQTAIDLKVARRQSGLTQTDLGQLLGVDRSRVSKVEHAKYGPTVGEIAKLCLIYDRTFSVLCPSATADAYRTLQTHLKVMNVPVSGSDHRDSRTQTLTALAKRLQGSFDVDL